MIFLDMNFRSSCLGGNAQVSILLPQEGVAKKTLWLLHGLHGDHTSWMRNTSIERYASGYDVAVVMPNAQNSWYADTAYGAAYFSFITKELPALLSEKLSGFDRGREDNIIAGLSMGGYGAVKAALTFPDRYGACISLSGSLDITRKNRPYPLPLWQGNFGFSLESAEALAGSKEDLFALAEKNKAEGRPFPKLYQWCGTEDALLCANNEFSALLDKLGVAHEYRTSEGTHSWRYWDEKIREGLDFILKNEGL